MKKLYLLLIVTMLPGIILSQKNDRAINELIKIDSEFSSYSVKNGMNKAFYKFADTSVVLLKPNMMPLKGMSALKKFHENIDDSKFTLCWIPIYARASKKADLGYTYGTWKVSGGEEDYVGTYVSIWAKNALGEWKLVLDTGNDGLGE